MERLTIVSKTASKLCLNEHEDGACCRSTKRSPVTGDCSNRQQGDISQVASGVFPITFNSRALVDAWFRPENVGGRGKKDKGSEIQGLVIQAKVIQSLISLVQRTVAVAIIGIAHCRITGPGRERFRLPRSAKHRKRKDENHN